jgi:hypothetical protein
MVIFWAKMLFTEIIALIPWRRSFKEEEKEE